MTHCCFHKRQFGGLNIGRRKQKTYTRPDSWLLLGKNENLEQYHRHPSTKCPWSTATRFSTNHTHVDDVPKWKANVIPWFMTISLKVLFHQMCNIVEYIIQLLPIFLPIYIIVFYIYSVVIFNASKPQLPLHPPFPVLSSPTTLLKSSKKKKRWSSWITFF